MKKIICLLLAIACMLAMASCNQQPTGDGGEENTEPKYSSIAEVVENAKPVTVTTLISYVGEDELKGSYITTTDGAKAVFEYEYQRYATVAEMLDSRIKTVKGKIYYKDGQVATSEGEEWVSSEINEIVDFTLRIDESKFTTYNVSKDKKTLNGTISPENAARVLGVDVQAQGDISIEIVTNGTYLYYVNISYKSAGGADVTVNTSFDYSPVTVKVPGEA